MPLKTESELTALVGAKNWCRIYAELRTVLDAVLIASLKYVMDGPEKQRKLRALGVIELLKTNVLSEIGGLPKPPATATGETAAEGGEVPKTLSFKSGGECGEGLYNCYGVCVPYMCVDADKDY